MSESLLDHYRAFSLFTNPGAYQDLLRRTLPDDIRELGFLVRKQMIHRMILQAGNTGSNKDLKYGDMTRVPWYRQPEDDYLVTTAAMLAELYRRDPRGFVADRMVENKLILTCRFVAILMASLLKTKGIPARVRSGFAPYFHPVASEDHWITQYWHERERRWVTIDVDASLEKRAFDPYDLPDGTFDFSADAWLAVRAGKASEERFHNAGGGTGLAVVGWELFYDFHCLMNSEIIYLHVPAFLHHELSKLSQEELQAIDNLARLMQAPDEHFEALQELWETKKEFRLLQGALL